MKNILLVLLLGFLAQTGMAQDCAEKMKAARNSKASGNFRLAIKQFQAAKSDCGEARAVEIEREIVDVFDKIDSLKKVAERDRLKANLALEYAKIQQGIAQQKEAEADKQRRIARQALDSVQVLLDTVQVLIAKGRELQNTFADSSTAAYLYKTGLSHFSYDTITQARDYQNALTYFALARFLKPNDTLTYLVHAAQKGIEAEADFRAGKLDEAQAHYDSIMLLLAFIQKESGFEQQRLQQIKTVDSLYRNFKLKNRVAAEAVTLEGNWWTLPEDLQQYSNLKNIVFVSNEFNFRQLPLVLTQLPGLVSMTFDQCINVRTLREWKQVPGLKQLIVSNNQNLYTLGNLSDLAQLQYLTISQCPALTFVEGCHQLKFFATENSPQLRVNRLLQENNGIQELQLADLPDNTLKIDHLLDLEVLSLARMKTTTLTGLDKNERLKRLKMNQLDQLSSFVPPVQLEEIKIDNCDGLTSIDQWKPSDRLTKIALYDNAQLERMPDWRNYPNLKELLIQNDNELKRIYGTKTLKGVERIYIINNPNLITNSVHAGFGFEWGVNISSVKLEFEHRRRVRLANGRPDLGFKAVGLYARKDFDYQTVGPSRKADGYIAGVAINYYSPFWVYTGAGMGVGHFQSRFSDNTSSTTTNLVWINNLGAQFAPPFLKKDKMSLNMDLYTVFVKKDYYILPSFGLTYYHTLGMHPKTYFVRPGDARKKIYQKGADPEVNKVIQQF